MMLGLLVWDVPTARLAAATLAIVGLLFSAYLVVVQLFVIDAICWWCMANDLVVAPALAALTLLRLRPRTWRSTFGATRSRISARLSPVQVMPWFRRL